MQNLQLNASDSNDTGDGAVASLCEACRLIRFEALLGPTPSEIAKIINGSHAGYIFARAEKGSEISKVQLGSLARMRTSMLCCPLCALFVYILESQGLTYRDATGSHPLDCQDVYFRADPDLSYYAKITARDASDQTVFALRRLCITAHHVRAPDTTVAYFDHALQPCRVGALGRPESALAASDTVPLNFGGRRRPRQLDIQLVKRWINICRDEHGPSCRFDNNPSTMDAFRLIDVQQKCLCEFHNVQMASLHFAALSYTWGTGTFFQLESRNLQHLTEHSSLADKNLPRTILDSMEMTRLLGLQYIWVDALCIQQDSAHDKAYQITKMADIYSSAFITVVAAAGEGPEWGLPGLVAATRAGEQREVVVIPPSSSHEGLSLLNCLKSYPLDYDEYYSRGQESADINKWSRRAWTLQETALSYRRLTFTNEQVFWTCQKGYFCEESYFEVPDLSVKHFYPSVHKISLQELRNRGADDWSLYGELVDNYTRRDFTYDGDVFDAFGAITQSFESQSGTALLWGLPCSLFEVGLMWGTQHGVTRRTALSTLPMTSLSKRVAFPSWSWMGWKGQVDFCVTRHRQESERSTILCYVYTAHTRCFTHVSRVASRPGALSSIWGSDEISRSTPSLSDLQAHQPRLSPERLAAYPDAYLLFFRTSSAHFTICTSPATTPASHAGYSASPFPLIADPRDGTKVAGQLCRTPFGEVRTERYVAEFIMVGRREDPNLPEDVLPPMVLVFQIARDQDGIARRVNYGEINRGAWRSATPRDCFVALA